MTFLGSSSIAHLDLLLLLLLIYFVSIFIFFSSLSHLFGLGLIVGSTRNYFPSEI